MNTKFVRISIDIEVDNKLSDFSPSYRVYVENELFVERTYVQQDHQYLCEMLQIEALPGRYKVVFENLDPEKATFLTKNYSVMHGPARWLSKKYLEIYDES